jgi:hypothetical protein
MTSRQDKSSLLRQIAATEAELAETRKNERTLSTRLQSLQAELASQSASMDDDAGDEAPGNEAATALSSADKVELFRQLFRGRGDVYPKLWVNTRSGKKGYSPTCSNEWRTGVCAKPRIKCSVCPNQGFLPVTDQVILDHLQGKHTCRVPR